LLLSWITTSWKNTYQSLVETTPQVERYSWFSVGEERPAAVFAATSGAFCLDILPDDGQFGSYAQQEANPPQRIIYGIGFSQARVGECHWGLSRAVRFLTLRAYLDQRCSSYFTLIFG
jgi:hypothetical protein